MKRVVIVAALLAFCIWVSVYSAMRVHQLSDQFLEHVEAAERYLTEKDEERLDAELAEIERFWSEQERTLVYFIRHQHLDGINASVAKLASLAAYNDDANLAAELASIRWLVEHLEQTETPTLRNML